MKAKASALSAAGTARLDLLKEMRAQRSELSQHRARNPALKTLEWQHRCGVECVLCWRHTPAAPM